MQMGNTTMDSDFGDTEPKTNDVFQACALATSADDVPVSFSAASAVVRHSSDDDSSGFDSDTFPVLPSPTSETGSEPGVGSVDNESSGADIDHPPVLPASLIVSNGDDSSDENGQLISFTMGGNLVTVKHEEEEIRVADVPVFYFPDEVSENAAVPSYVRLTGTKTPADGEKTSKRTKRHKKHKEVEEEGNDPFIPEEEKVEPPAPLPKRLPRHAPGEKVELKHKIWVRGREHEFSFADYWSTWSSDFYDFADYESLSTGDPDEVYEPRPAKPFPVKERNAATVAKLAGRVIHALGLPRTDSDAFVTLRLVDGHGKERTAIAKSEIIRNAGNPEWNFDFDFGVIEKGLALETFVCESHQTHGERQIAYAKKKVRRIEPNQFAPVRIRLGTPSHKNTEKGTLFGSLTIEFRYRFESRPFLRKIVKFTLLLRSEKVTTIEYRSGERCTHAIIRRRLHKDLAQSPVQTGLHFRSLIPNSSKKSHMLMLKHSVTKNSFSGLSFSILRP
jgi:hypothetical protein